MSTTIRRTVIQPTRYGDNKQSLKKRSKSDSPRGKSTIPSLFPEINDRFRKIRAHLSLTQQEMADKLSSPGITVTVSTMKAVENEVVSPGIYLIRMLKKVSGKSYDYILDGRG